MAKNTNYTEKNVSELTNLLAEKRENLRNVRFMAAGARPKDSTEPKKLRAEIARIMTELGAKKRTA
jgi:ribosomal protein L29